jgi:surface antigen
LNVLGAQTGEGHGRTAAIIVCTLTGALIGRQIGENMDDVDRMRAARVLNDSRRGARAR